MQAVLIPALVTTTAPMLVLIWSVVVAVVAYCCCILLELALMLVLTFYCFLSWCFPSSNWQKYSTCTHATCIMWWWLQLYVVVTTACHPLGCLRLYSVLMNNSTQCVGICLGVLVWVCHTNVTVHITHATRTHHTHTHTITYMHLLSAHSECLTHFINCQRKYQIVTFPQNMADTDAHGQTETHPMNIAT